MKTIMNCTNEVQLVGGGQPWLFAIKHYIVPIQVIVGLAGNFLTVVILNSRCLRSRTTILLTCLTLADMGCLACQIPSSLGTFAFAYTNEPFRKFFYSSYLPLLMLSNSFSTASIWLALSVTAERVLVISRPLRAQLPFSPARTTALVLGIFAGALATSVFHLFRSEYVPCVMPLPGNYSSLTKLKLHQRVKLFNNPLARQWFDASTLFNLVFILCLPLLGMIFFNWILLHFIRSSRKTLSAVGRTHSGRLAMATERKIGIMVCVIISAYVIFNIPSAVIAVLQWQRIGTGKGWLKHMVYVSNSLVATGKTINFVLYCLSSDHFRQKVKDASSGSLCRPSAHSTACRKKSSEMVAKSPYVFRLISGSAQDKDKEPQVRLLATHSAPPSIPQQIMITPTLSLQEDAV